MIDVTALGVGTPVPPFSRVGSFATWTHFAAVNHEIADHHLDDEVARREGFPGAFAMAPLTFSYVQTMLREWVGEQGRIVTVDIRLRSPFLRGRTLTAAGEVRQVHRDGDDVLVEIDVWADDDLGTRLVQGSATVAVPAQAADLKAR
jgi:acyl dehydratase